MVKLNFLRLKVNVKNAFFVLNSDIGYGGHHALLVHRQLWRMHPDLLASSSLLGRLLSCLKRLELVGTQSFPLICHPCTSVHSSYFGT